MATATQLLPAEDVLEWAHADFWPTGFARSLRRRLACLVRRGGDVGGVARKMLDDGDLDACHVLYDAMLDANVPTKRCERMVLDCQLAAASEKAVAWSAYPVTWAVAWSHSDKWMRYLCAFDCARCVEPALRVRDYAPWVPNVLRFPDESSADAYERDRPFVIGHYRHYPMRVTPVRGRVNVPDFLKG